MCLSFDTSPFLFACPSFRPQCHRSTPLMPQVSNLDATLQQVKWLAFTPETCGISVTHPSETDDPSEANRPSVQGKQTMRLK